MRFLTTAALLLALAFRRRRARRAATTAPSMKARTHFAAGEYKEALDIYVRLYAETMHPTYLRNIARCHQNLGNADKAISSFREYLRKAQDLTADRARGDRGLHQGDGAAQAVEGSAVDRAARQPSRAPTAPPPAAPPRRSPRRPLVGPPAVTASGARDDEGGPFYTRVWFWVWSQASRPPASSQRCCSRATAVARPATSAGTMRAAGCH